MYLLLIFGFFKIHCVSLFHVYSFVYIIYHSLLLRKVALLFQYLESREQIVNNQKGKCLQYLDKINWIHLKQFIIKY